jgi:DNA-binding transcriptional ArsR family regulator
LVIIKDEPHMKLKLQLVQDGKVLFDMPLSITDWSKEELETEFQATEGEFGQFSKLFDALSHETRLRMMRRLVEDENRTMSFADFMRDLDLNPKTVWENSKKLEESGLLKKTGRGRYSCSDFGQTTFIMMSLALHRFIQSLQQMDEY